MAVKDGTGATLASYSYDALSRRTTESVGGIITALYYSAAWQMLEERVGGATTTQYVWSLAYVDALVLRDRDADGNGSLEERLFVTQDANWNTTALLDAAGAAKERYLYTPYGQANVRKGDWTGAGDPNYGPGAAGVYGWRYLFQGGRADRNSGLVHFRNRDYSPTMGRWIQQDPAGYVDGANLYQFVGSNPVNGVDPWGLQEFTLSDRYRYLQQRPSTLDCHQSPQFGDFSITAAEFWGATGEPVVTTTWDLARGWVGGFLEVQTGHWPKPFAFAPEPVSSFSHGFGYEFGRVCGAAMGVVETIDGVKNMGLGLGGLAGSAGLTATGAGAVLGVPGLVLSLGLTAVGALETTQGVMSLNNYFAQDAKGRAKRELDKSNEQKVYRGLYKAADYHGAKNTGLKSRAPTNGQDVLGRSVQVKPTSPRRVGYDPATGEFVVFDKTIGDVYHGHVRTWDQLTDDMRNALIRTRMVDGRGRP